MVANPRAGQPALPEDLIDVAHLVTAYYTVDPDPDDVAQQVAFGTSGHRGSSLDGAFNEAHILATTQAIAEYRAAGLPSSRPPPPPGGPPSRSAARLSRLELSAL